MSPDSGATGSDEVTFDEIVATWYKRAREAQLSHYRAAARFSNLNQIVGAPAAVLSAATGTTIFATLQTGATDVVSIILGLAALTSAVAGAVHTFSGYADRASKHRAAAMEYGSIRREIEQYQSILPSDPNAQAVALGGLRRRIDDAARLAPEVPRRVWKAVQPEIEDTARPRGFVR